MIVCFSPDSATAKEDEHTWQLHEECWRRMSEICNAIILWIKTHTPTAKISLSEIEPIFLKSFSCGSILAHALSTSVELCSFDEVDTF